MTAAHAFELPPDDGLMADAVDAAAAGEVVYLTRGGRRIATIESAERRYARLTRIAEFWRDRELEMAESCHALWVDLQNADERTRQLARQVFDGVLSQLEDAADNAAADAALADPAASVPLAELLAQNADLMASDAEQSG
jgi:antitoxin (DNA-binding transcriptional repressor) of toxin-antitoxin stability system